MNVAFIPVRGGSKSIPLKNIKQICGRPLVYWTAKSACECNYIDKVYVSTDSEEIRVTVEGFKKEGIFDKVQVISRSDTSASDTATTESAMLEFADAYKFENIALVQATSPLLRASDLNRGFEVLSEHGTDSVLSVVRQKRFHWRIDSNGYAYPTNYDIFHRPRRQVFDGYLVENGAFYITSRSKLIESRNRVSGNIRVVEMSEDSFFEIDEPSDWIIIEALMKKNSFSFSSDIPHIELFLTDCDGCLTNGGMYYSEYGDELKKFNTKDGMGFALLKKHNIRTGIITSEQVDLNRRRAEKLQIDYYEAGCKDKATAVNKICKENNIELENVCYIGDDLNDITTMRMVGFSCCPADAIAEVKETAKYICKTRGGEGVIREVAEKILKRNET